MDISPQDFLDLGKNSNQPQFILYKVGVVLKIKGYGKIFYAQMFMIRWKYYDNKKEKEQTKNVNSKGNLQHQYAGLILIMSG